MDILTFSEEKITKRNFIILVLIAYVFSVLVRLIWVYQMKDMNSFYWNGELMINTNDGYYFASWVQAIVDHMHQYNLRIEDNIFKHAVVALTVLTVKLGISIDTAILYMSTIISSLVVIPIILIGRLYGATLFGFFAALLGSVTWSYYNRTMTGYYDTDMFSAMAPMFILYFLIKTIEENNIKNIFYASLMIAIYPFLYDQGKAIVYAMGLLSMIYMVVFHRKEYFTYKMIILLSIALLPMPFVLKILFFIIVLIILEKKEFSNKQLIMISIVSIVVFLVAGNVFGLILSKIVSYIEKEDIENGLHFFSVNQTVREAGKIPFEVMANRISGSTIGITVALIGYVLMLVRYRAMILALPLIGIGIFSLWGGLRFTVYAVPVAAMGAVYLFYVVAGFVHNKTLRYGVIAFLTALLLYPNIVHIIGYKVPTVFSKSEVQALDTLKKISKPHDYTVAWWDYGYPIWYYSDTNTLIDGGKHNNDNFIVSQMLLTSSQTQAANLARVSVETYIKNHGIVVDSLFQNGEVNPSKFLNDLKDINYKLPQKTVDIYFYLPYRMVNILPTINLFSNLDLKTGKKFPQNFFYSTTRFQEKDDIIYLGSNIKLLKKQGVVQLGKQRVPIKNFVMVGHNKEGKLQKVVQTVNRQSPISIIYMQDYQRIIVLDTKMFNSLYIQLFVFENYDKNLFEPVVISPYAKIFKLKR